MDNSSRRISDTQKEIERIEQNLNRMRNERKKMDNKDDLDDDFGAEEDNRDRRWNGFNKTVRIG